MLKSSESSALSEPSLSMSGSVQSPMVSPSKSGSFTVMVNVAVVVLPLMSVAV